MIHRFFRLLAHIIAKLTMRVEIVGSDNLPSTPPYLLVTNHLSALDLPVIVYAFPHPIRPFAAKEHQSNFLFAPILKGAKAIWVNRGEVDRRALREALAVLERGEALGVAPEGTRSAESHALQPARPGVAYLATRADVPIVPVGIAGTEKVKENLLRLRRTSVRIAVGEAFRLPGTGRVRTNELREYTDLIMHRLAELLPAAYRGVYG